VAFGIGRALPIVVLAPLADHPVGIRCVELMGERPALYARARLGDSLALLAAAGALTVSAATASSPTASFSGADPSAAGRAVAFQRGPDASAFLRRNGQVTRLPGREPGIGGHFLVSELGGRLSIRRRSSGAEVSSLDPGPVWASAVSNRWVVYGQTRNQHDVIKARPLVDGRPAGTTQQVARVRRPARLGHPGIDGNLVVLSIARPRSSAVVWRRLGESGGGTVARSSRGALCCASTDGRDVLYVLSIRARQNSRLIGAPPLEQRLLVEPIRGGPARRVYSLAGTRGTLFSTALSRRRAYATVLNRQGSRIVVIPR
jgi:hypothetical protein